MIVTVAANLHINQFMFKMHLVLIKEFKYFSQFNFNAICTCIFNVELSVFEWQPKVSELLALKTYKIKILYEYESFNMNRYFNASKLAFSKANRLR